MYKKVTWQLKKKLTSIMLATCLLISVCCFAGLSVAADDTVIDASEISINYVSEKIELGQIGDFASSEGSKTPKYMYSPNASVSLSSKKGAAEKWYPVYGDTIDITKYIPSANKKECIFAIRLAEDLPQQDGTYKSRTVVIIEGRPNTTVKELKQKAGYNPQTEMIVVDTYLRNMGYDYQVDLGEWNYRMTSDLDVSSKYMPLGGTVTIRVSANQEYKKFASLPVKLKVPKAPSAPNLKMNEKSAKIVGLKKTMGWSTTIDGSYKSFTDNSIEFDLFEAKLANISSFETYSSSSSGTSGSTENQEYIVVYVKTLATEKKPSSAVQALYVPKDFLQQQIKGTN